MISNDFQLQLRGYGLVTADITYHLPDHPHLVQTLLWQKYDMSPKFPELEKFLEFWEKHIEGPVKSVRIAHFHLMKPPEIRMASAMLKLH